MVIYTHANVIIWLFFPIELLENFYPFVWNMEYRIWSMLQEHVNTVYEPVMWLSI